MRDVYSVFDSDGDYIGTVATVTTDEWIYIHNGAQSDTVFGSKESATVALRQQTTTLTLTQVLDKLHSLIEELNEQEEVAYRAEQSAERRAVLAAEQKDWNTAATASLSAAYYRGKVDGKIEAADTVHLVKHNLYCSIEQE